MRPKIMHQLEDWRLYHNPVQEWEVETNEKIREWIALAKPLTKITKKTRKRKVDPAKTAADTKFLHIAKKGHQTKMRSKAP
jgi:hypothetical protein